MTTLCRRTFRRKDQKSGNLSRERRILAGADVTCASGGDMLAIDAWLKTRQAGLSFIAGVPQTAFR